MKLEDEDESEEYSTQPLRELPYHYLLICKNVEHGSIILRMFPGRNLRCVSASVHSHLSCNVVILFNQLLNLVPVQDKEIKNNINPNSPGVLKLWDKVRTGLQKPSDLRNAVILNRIRNFDVSSIKTIASEEAFIIGVHHLQADRCEGKL